VQFKTPLKLTVTPQITANTVIMKIQLETRRPTSAGASTIPPIDTQQANTTVLIGDSGRPSSAASTSSSQQSNRTGPVLHNIRCSAGCSRTT
jgi:hypothetical protein